MTPIPPLPRYVEDQPTEKRNGAIIGEKKTLTDCSGGRHPIRVELQIELPKSFDYGVTPGQRDLVLSEIGRMVIGLLPTAYMEIDRRLP